jgi:ribosomal protein S18 acetylase RimI-like enzyme
MARSRSVSVNGAALVHELLRRGLDRGIRRAYLQVVKSNVAAAALYRRIGLTDAYEYWYRIRPEDV